MYIVEECGGVLSGEESEEEQRGPHTCLESLETCLESLAPCLAPSLSSLAPSLSSLEPISRVSRVWCRGRRPLLAGRAGGRALAMLDHVSRSLAIEIEEHSASFEKSYTKNRNQKQHKTQPEYLTYQNLIEECILHFGFAVFHGAFHLNPFAITLLLKKKYSQGQQHYANTKNTTPNAWLRCCGSMCCGSRWCDSRRVAGYEVPFELQNQIYMLLMLAVAWDLLFSVGILTYLVITVQMVMSSHEYFCSKTIMEEDYPEWTRTSLDYYGGNSGNRYHESLSLFLNGIFAHNG